MKNGNIRYRAKYKAEEYVKNNKLCSTDKYGYILKDHFDAFWPPVMEAAKKLKIDWHDKGNLISSQILAVNIALALDIDITARDILGASVNRNQLCFEWKDDEGKGGILSESSIHRTTVDIFYPGHDPLLCEVKYAEAGKQPCRARETSNKGSVCHTAGRDLATQCPLIARNGTRYMDVIADPDGPFSREKIWESSPECFALEGEYYQLMRLVSLAWLKRKKHKTNWRVVLICCRANNKIIQEGKKFAASLRIPDIFSIITVEDILQKAVKVKRLEDWISFMKNQYLVC